MTDVRAGGTVEVQEFSGLDEARLETFRKYARRHFHDEFRAGQGTEDVLATLARFGQGGTWLDLGAGPTTLFWSIPLSGVDSVACCDLMGEALKILYEFAKGHEVPRCYEQVMEMFGRGPDHLTDIKRRIRHYYTFDALGPWPEELRGQAYDLVTAMGLFGLAPNPQRYMRCFEYVRPHLRDGGRMIGANWIRSRTLVRAKGHDNSYLSEALVAEGARRADLEVLELKRVSVKHDPDYDAVIVWAAEALPVPSMAEMGRAARSGTAARHQATQTGKDRLRGGEPGSVCAG